MLSDIESEILLTAMNFVQMEGEFVLETSAKIMKKAIPDTGKVSMFELDVLIVPNFVNVVIK